MTTRDEYGTPELVFPSAPIEGDTLATVDTVARGRWHTDREWRLFVSACEYVGDSDGLVSHDLVRADLTNHQGVLCISPRRLSAFYNRAVAIGLLEFDHWAISGDTKGRNAGRPARHYRLRKATT